MITGKGKFLLWLIRLDNGNPLVLLLDNVLNRLYPSSSGVFIRALESADSSGRYVNETPMILGLTGMGVSFNCPNSKENDM